MNKSEIIKQARHYFGKDRSYIKDLVLGYTFDGKLYEQWQKDIHEIIPNVIDVSYGIFDDVVSLISEGKTDKIDWNWIGDLSWTFEIVLNPGIDKGYDWDKKLATKCKGTARILRVLVSDVIPCYTYDHYYMTYSKLGNYYEFGPIFKRSNEEKKLLKKVCALLDSKGFQYLDNEFSNRKFNGMYSDINQDGRASLFDILFSDTVPYQTEVLRMSDKEIVEKSGMRFRWREYYSKKGKLVERIESRWTKGGDYLKVTLNNTGQIKLVEVSRKKTAGKNNKNFTLDILGMIARRNKQEARKKKGT